MVGRLPVYLRTLELMAGEGREVASSQEQAPRLGLARQIRKDLSHFGEFGKQGTGYNVAFLRRQLEQILKVNCVWPVVLVGAGYLGHALASYNGFEHRGFRIVAVFDSDPAKIGNRVSPSIVVEPVSAIGGTLQRCQSRSWHDRRARRGGAKSGGYAGRSGHPQHSMLRRSR